MRRKKYLWCWLSLSCFMINNGIHAQNLVAYVNPLIGTAPSSTITAKKHSEAGSELKGQTFPAVGTPHAMTYWTPQTHATEQKCLSPYYYNDTTIQGFRASHWISGSCTQDYGSVTIMLLKNKLVTDPVRRGALFSHKDEKAAAGYYSVLLAGESVKAELTALSHSGIIRFTCYETGIYYLLIEPNSDRGEGFLSIDTVSNVISGFNPVHRIYQDWGASAGFSGHFYIQVNKRPVAHGCWNGPDLLYQQDEIHGNGKAVGMFLRLSMKKGESMLVKTGMSFSNVTEAKKNLAIEIPAWDFEKTHTKTTAAWNDALAAVQVKGGSMEDKIKFYTALYHAQLLPRVFSDADGSYPRFGGHGEIEQTNGFDYYEDYSMWDTYRAVHPLFNIIDPARNRDMVRSLLLKAQQGGWLPIFPCWNNYTSAMIGDHCIAMISDAIIKNIGGFDLQQAYSVMRKNAFTVNDDSKSYADGKGRRALASYLQYGYVPLEDSVKESFHKNEQVSRTMEYAYDDYVLAKVADKLGYKEDYTALMKRSKNYKNVFDSVAGFVRGKYADGKWIGSFDPYKRASYITEGSPFQYTFSAPQDIPGLISLMGGTQSFINKLDTFFEKGYYWHGNEHGQHIPYLYVYAGQAWKTQQLIRKIIAEEYGEGPGGISGNEDAGQMSAWLVFSMIGLYPVCPGNTEYAIGSPVFDEIRIRLPNKKKFIIRAINNSADNKYIQKAVLYAAQLKDMFIQHYDITTGGTLLLYMSAKPVKGKL